MNVRIIANPVSGGGKGKVRAEALLHALNGNGIEAELVFTQQAGDAPKESARPGADCIVSVGGDGTAHEVANGMKDTDASLAILPTGTANVVARELKIPSDPVDLALLISSRCVRTIDVGVIEGEWFLLGAGAGLDAAVATRLSEQRGKRSSYLKWVDPAIRTVLSYGFPPIRATVDGRTLTDSAQYAVVGNCRYSAGVFPATRRARVDDGLLDVCLLHDLSVLKIPGLILGVWGPHFPERKDVIYAQGKSIELEPASLEPVPLQVDGDPAGNIPVRIEVEAQALRIVAPV